MYEDVISTAAATWATGSGELHYHVMIAALGSSWKTCLVLPVFPHIVILVYYKNGPSLFLP